MSLSQFNLPASIPSSQTLGVQAGSRSLEQTKASTVVLANSKVMPNKSQKTAASDNALKLNGVLSDSVAGEADGYDPDQPLWNNGCPDAQGGLVKLSLANSSAKYVLDADSSERQSFRISDETSEQLSGNFVAGKGSHRTTSSVWGRIGSGVKQETGSKINDCTSLGNETKVDYKDIMTTDPSLSGKFSVAGETGSRFTSIKPIPRPKRDFGFSERKPSQKAERTLFVHRIPQNVNRPRAILSHFRRFGEVVDIYIPMNSENAFVQFSKKEEAEAALKAPDAVMGNRFIRVWWANRDRIPGGSSGPGKSVRSPMVVGTPFPSQLPLADRGKESLLFEVQKQSSGQVAETSLSFLALPNKTLAIGSKFKPPVQKKMENLNLLEELRKKQEAFDLKRDEFRRQLAKFEKQATLTKKGEADAEQAVKRRKGVTGKKVANTTAPKSAECSNVGACGEAEKLIENSNPVEIHFSPISEANLTTSRQSSKNINTTGPLAPQLNRFKLDTHPTSFRILPPLPAEFTEIAVLKDHFSSFGDLASVVLEESNAHIDNSESEQSQNCSACVTFTTRHSAENAYINGKFWQGHSLQFMWLTISPSLKIDSGIHDNLSHSTHMEASNAKIQYEPVTSGSSSLSTDIRSGDSMDVEGTHIVVSCVSDVLLQTSVSSPTTSCEKCIPISALPVVEDKADINFAQ